MDVGMNLPVMVPGLDRAHVLEWSRRIEAGPFTHLAAGERITFPNPEITVTLSVAAAVTQRVKIFANVVVLPMHDAVLAAKQLATLDVMSGGRLLLGVGAGARDEDFRAVGAERPERPLAFLAEQVATLRRVWVGENVVPGALRPVEPLPVQPGGPPILSASLSEASIRRAASWADGLCGFGFGPSREEVARAWACAREAWPACGRDTPPRLVTSLWFALGPDPRAQIDDYVGRYLAFLGEGVPQRVAPLVRAMSPAALRDVLAELRDLGTDEVSLVPTALDPDEISRVRDLLG